MIRGFSPGLAQVKRVQISCLSNFRTLRILNIAQPWAWGTRPPFDQG